jgi:hypothetical protein
MDWNYFWDGDWPSGLIIVILIFVVCYIHAKLKKNKT